MYSFPPITFVPRQSLWRTNFTLSLFFRPLFKSSSLIVNFILCFVSSPKREWLIIYIKCHFTILSTFCHFINKTFGPVRATTLSNISNIDFICTNIALLSSSAMSSKRVFITRPAYFSLVAKYQITSKYFLVSKVNRVYIQ